MTSVTRVYANYVLRLRVGATKMESRDKAKELKEFEEKEIELLQFDLEELRNAVKHLVS